jgi:hypothetical protein
MDTGIIFDIMSLLVSGRSQQEVSSLASEMYKRVFGKSPKELVRFENELSRLGESNLSTLYELVDLFISRSGIEKRDVQIIPFLDWYTKQILASKYVILSVIGCNVDGIQDLGPDVYYWFVIAKAIVKAGNECVDADSLEQIHNYVRYTTIDAYGHHATKRKQLIEYVHDVFSLYILVGLFAIAAKDPKKFDDVIAAVRGEDYIDLALLICMNDNSISDFWKYCNDVSKCDLESFLKFFCSIVRELHIDQLCASQNHLLSKVDYSTLLLEPKYCRDECK